jgi:hypothetical protein
LCGHPKLGFLLLLSGVLPTSVGTDEIKAVLDAATLSKQALEQQLVATQTEELSLELQLKAPDVAH